MPATLAERLRAIVGPHPLPPTPAAPQIAAGAPSSIDLPAALGGEWRDELHGRCLVVERRVAADERHGAMAVGALADALETSADDAPIVAGGAPARPPFVFFDLETTGLSGGAGTYAFLFGCGWFEPDRSFATRQLVLPRPGDERGLLAAVDRELTRAGALVSFNGKTFDAPLLETRFQFHRVPWRAGTLPHLDLLHPSRAFWRDSSTSCALGALEQHVLGAARCDDVPGFEIPARYFQFVRTGDARPLAGVLAHNRLDLLSLAGLTARVFSLVRRGPEAVRDAAEALGLGRLYARAGLDGRARAAFVRAAEGSDTTAPVRIDALRALALMSRRARRFDEGALWWRRLLETPGCPAPLAREASEALAIHHEHRVRDLETAKEFALRSLGPGAGCAWTEAVRHRLDRIERKLERSDLSASRPLLSSLSSPSRLSSGSLPSARRTSS